MKTEISRESQKYQVLDDVNLSLDLVVLKIDEKEIVIYEVTEEFWDDTYETKTFDKLSNAESYFNQYVEMVL